MHAWFCVNEFTFKPTAVSLNFVCQDRQNDAGDTLQSTLYSLQASENSLIKMQTPELKPGFSRIFVPELSCTTLQQKSAALP